MRRPEEYRQGRVVRDDQVATDGVRSQRMLQGRGEVGDVAADFGPVDVDHEWAEQTQQHDG